MKIQEEIKQIRKELAEIKMLLQKPAKWKDLEVNDEPDILSALAKYYEEDRFACVPTKYILIRLNVPTLTVYRLGRILARAGYKKAFKKNVRGWQVREIIIKRYEEG